MKTNFSLISLISFFVYAILGIVFTLHALPQSGVEKNLAVANSFQLRGIAKFDGHWSFSLHDPETGIFFWLSLDEEKYGIKITQFDEESKSIIVKNGHNEQILIFDKSLGDSSVSIYSNDYAGGPDKILSKYNKELLKKHTLLIKEDDSKFRDVTAQIQLKALLETNPSTEDWCKYLELNANKIDWNEFSKIKYEGVLRRRLKQQMNK